MSRKIVATIEARMTSSRLPGKVLMPANGKPMLWYTVERIKHVSLVDEIVLATTVNPTDDVLVEFARQNGISVYRGDEENVMQRVIDAADSVGGDVIMEITGDCPVIDADIMEQCLLMYFHNKCDYLSNTVVKSYPNGMDTQVFALEVLKDSAGRTSTPLHQEHVTMHIREHPEIYLQIDLVAPPNMHWPDLGLSLDEQADYVLLKNLIEYFSDDRFFTCSQVIDLLKKNLDWVVNENVYRKGFE